MDEEDDVLGIDAELLETVGVDDLADPLELGEVVAASDRAERRVELGGIDGLFREFVRGVTGIGAVDVDGLREAVDLEAMRGLVGRPQGHAAADVAADEVRVDQAADGERCTDRSAVAGMQIGHADGALHPG